MDFISAKRPISKVWFLVAGAYGLAALLLPWVGFDFPVGSFFIHLHSLKNPTGFLLVVIGLSFLVPAWRTSLAHWMERLQDSTCFSSRELPWVLAGIAALLFTNAKLHQHFSLQTHAFDLGIFANVCWNTLHGRFLYDSVKGAPYLADHFQPILILLAPAFWLWNNAGVLLIIQSVGLALAVPPLFWLTRNATGSRLLATGLCLLYLTRPSVNAVSGFDFHPIALAIPILLWGLKCLENQREGAFWLSCLLALTLKEDVPIALGALGLVLCFTNAAWRKKGLGLVGLAMGAFLFETQVAIPHYLRGLPSIHFSRYSNLGNSYADVILNIFREPQRFASAILWPTTKWGSFFRYLGSFGFLPTLNPANFFPVIAALLPHFLSQYTGQYTLSGQYTALSLPFILYASSKGLARLLDFFNDRWSGSEIWLFAGCLVLSGGALLTNSRYAHPAEWSRVKEFYRLAGTIPPNASVRAQSDLLPHVCLREKISLFAPYEEYKYLPLFEPARAQTDYILLDCYGNTWPMDDASFKRQILKLASEGRYNLIDFKEGFELWKRKES